MKRQCNSQTLFEVTTTCSIPLVVVFLYKVIGLYFFGEIVSWSVLTIIKRTTGRLRPNFLSVCRPDFQSINCTQSQGSSVYYRYITEDACIKDNPGMLMDAKMSFPSGHSLLSFYSAFFLVLYLQKRMTWSFSRLLRLGLQVSLIFSAAYVGSSRVADYRHHISDVIAGALIGVVIATSMFIYLLGFIDGWQAEECNPPYHACDNGSTTMLNDGEADGKETIDKYHP